MWIRRFLVGRGCVLYRFRRNGHVVGPPFCIHSIVVCMVRSLLSEFNSMSGATDNVQKPGAPQPEPEFEPEPEGSSISEPWRRMWKTIQLTW